MIKRIDMDFCASVYKRGSVQIIADLPAATIGVSALDTRNPRIMSPHVFVSARKVSIGGVSPISPESITCLVTVLAKTSASLNCDRPV